MTNKNILVGKHFVQLLLFVVCVCNEHYFIAALRYKFIGEKEECDRMIAVKLWLVAVEILRIVNC